MADVGYFFRLLNRCVVSTYDFVEGAVLTMHEETGVSAVQSPAILQVLLAVTIKHHNHEVLQKLAVHQATTDGLLKYASQVIHGALEKVGIHQAASDTIFTYASEVILSRLESSEAPLKTWEALAQGGWISASQIPASVREKVAMASMKPGAGDPRNLEVPGAILNRLAKERASTELEAYFPYIPRTLYTGISPHPIWPGSPVLVKYAAARAGQEGVDVLRVFVELGGMDVNDSKTWWKAGPHDPRYWNSKCDDESDCMETPLHIAVDTGNFLMVEYLLTHGAKRIADSFGRDQWERAQLRGNNDVLAVLEKHGWRKESGLKSFLKSF